ncbi:MAG: 2-oxoglutarate:acceptor oxidoreductase [Sulfurimonas sp. RIFCSPHIGHO2_12_FULL_36_9]|jgi:2-oxoglutarate ferredoxin oxidoreductase subunit delta|uniref:4Fe-4S dicluster domain-containing protein n=1 Tax=unclassified Sulfurimonas TaxID=2623549 RepID=UPI0008C68835|nr:MULTISPECIES: 4Fe-4S dicluster domain-containing protein [unclassified Sulfurimonas]OHD97020.1 MAG: 2-oxoglutarate:acceptor oxidoreductase [Sulfurimonas sp. RIFCSPLOWO2_02_FULL_36_28]OHD97941.1 MAG: 2-oxoglutarate:acceptor oxidoreductase [Sulfurimonas sp. RIFCSPHIGHO2_12_FULL_36_9]OHE02746.1 MAG: 2-oxoglutarate:acceptor oxidoreductase [Sulfurimonas sp. RIFCSPLOWO2_12_36_12]OHE07023.1 MAG: 2-oxoglutarate:acceptor oxidoreductase [Sulfurimonas sp. RIFCSPLOWO2_12_FULL_36_74]
MGTFKTENPGNQPVWVNTNNCKACDICVSVCPAGVLGMRYDNKSTLGAMISIEHPESCIGCMECELSCPDFAIYVADKKDYKFAKLTDDSKNRQVAVIANNYMSLSEQGVK